MSDLTDRAEQLLEGITPGPWDAYPIGDGEYEVYSKNIRVDGDVTSPMRNAADAEFIAAAPQLLADLLAEVKRCEADNAALSDTANRVLDENARLAGEVKRLTPREITSGEELDALPIGSVIRTSSKTYERWTEDGLWHSHFGSVTSETLAEPWYCGLACIRVIYVPEVKS